MSEYRQADEYCYPTSLIIGDDRDIIGKIRKLHEEASELEIGAEVERSEHDEVDAKEAKEEAQDHINKYNNYYHRIAKVLPDVRNTINRLNKKKEGIEDFTVSDTDVDNLDTAPPRVNYNANVNEGTKKIKGGYINRGKNPKGKSHKFKTKKGADAQRKAMFANGYKEDAISGTNNSMFNKPPLTQQDKRLGLEAGVRGNLGADAQNVDLTRVPDKDLEGILNNLGTQQKREAKEKSGLTPRVKSKEDDEYYPNESFKGHKTKPRFCKKCGETLTQGKCSFCNLNKD